MNKPTDLVRLSEYQKNWPEQFKKVAAMVKDSCGELIPKIDHIGSTSIVGMKAKNIIDIQCGLNNFDDMDEIIPKLESLGFNYVQDFIRDHVPFKDMDYIEPGWEKRFFRGNHQGIDCNVHVRIIGSANAQFALEFRDYLRTNKAIAKAYEQIKSRLEEAGVTYKTYTYIKDPVCDLIYAGFYKDK